MHEHQPSAGSGVGTPTLISSGSRIHLEVLYISGAIVCDSGHQINICVILTKSCALTSCKVAALDACSNWTGADLKRILQPFLQKGVAIAGIINEGRSQPHSDRQQKSCLTVTSFATGRHSDRGHPNIGGGRRQVWTALPNAAELYILDRRQGANQPDPVSMA